MGGKDHRAIIRHFVQFFDKDSAQIPQSIDDKFVVHDFVPHIDRRAPFLQRHFHDLDRPVHACAKAARGGKVQGQGWFGH